ncbi:MAG: hypothetical protein IH956_03530 [Chloroflexi bacterium]|nr:hypothetical protein [Chloroflexota bacterium]
MSHEDGDGRGNLEPDLEQARHTANVAHNVVVKFKEMGLPPDLDPELAALCTDLGDLWGAERRLSADLEGLVKSPHDWEAAGDSLLDLKASLDHIAWHLKSVRRPLNRIVRFAYREALAGQDSDDSR